MKETCNEVHMSSWKDVSIVQGSISCPAALLLASSHLWCSCLQATDKQLVMLPDRWHILIMEPGKEELVQQMAEWVSSRT
jgi:hypothetical protein